MRLFYCTVVSSIILNLGVALPIPAQIPYLPDLRQNYKLLTQDSNNLMVTACVRLEGRCLFTIADQKSEISQRINNIQFRLQDISRTYLERDAELTIRPQKIGNLENIYIRVGDRNIRLLTVTSWDAQIKGVDIATRANQIAAELEIGLQRAKQERQAQFLTRQGFISAGIVTVMLVGNWMISRRRRKLKQSQKEVASQLSNDEPISTQLTQRQQWNLKEVQYRFLQIIQGGVWLGGTLLILGLFPYTRALQITALSILRIPVRIVVVSLGTYLLIRLSYALIAHFNSLLATNYLLITQNSNRRLQLRTTTISSVAKSIVTLTWIISGVVVALSVIGVNIAPLLAGVGILGVALSLASQNLIRDAINGFFIILEDQYGVGDIINVDSVTGMVEKMNLRITQLRDSEGRLITIPNSEVKIVANLSSEWARADLNIPIAYQTDIDKALALVQKVAVQMSQDPLWQTSILESPQLLGVDNFDDRGVIVKLWIKTEPLKQWEVSREFRRRIKVAFDQAGITMPICQQFSI